MTEIMTFSAEFAGSSGQHQDYHLCHQNSGGSTRVNLTNFESGGRFSLLQIVCSNVIYFLIILTFAYPPLSSYWTNYLFYLIFLCCQRRPFLRQLGVYMNDRQLLTFILLSFSFGPDRELQLGFLFFVIGQIKSANLPAVVISQQLFFQLDIYMTDN